MLRAEDVKPCPKPRVEIPSLYAELAQVPDPRQASGKRHPLGAMLSLAGVALLCGYRSPYAIAEWVDNYERQYLARFGFTRKQPPGQVAVNDKNNEIGAILDLLSMLVLLGCVVTTDALLTQVKVAQQVLDCGGDYVFIVKQNQPALYADIQLLFATPPPAFADKSGHKLKPVPMGTDASRRAACKRLPRSMTT